MERFTKIYVLDLNGNTFYVRESATKQPLLFIEYGPYGHLYHRNGFEWDDVLRGNLGQQTTNDIYKLFDNAQAYLEENPTPWDKNSDIPFYKEYWVKK